MMDNLRNLIANLATKRNGTIVVPNGVCKLFIHLLIKEDFLQAKKVSCNRYKIKELSFSNIVFVNREPLKADELLNFATTVCPSIAGSVVVSTNKGIMTHQEASVKNLGGRALAVIY